MPYEIKEIPDDKKRCKYYWKRKRECMKMTNILQENGVVAFHASMIGNARDCLGNLCACYFKEYQIEWGDE